MGSQKSPKVLDCVVKDLPEVEGGKFKVADDGRIYRKRKDDGWELATQFRTARNGKYLAVTYYEEGRQKHYYSHRLIAAAYIPNPNNLPQVNHKDGNGLNNKIENLEWASRKSNMAHAVQNGLIPTTATAGIPCIACGSPTLQKDGKCVKCKKKERLDALRLEQEAERIKYVEDIFEQSDGEISEKHSQMLSMYAEGYTYSEIGDKFNVSRQRIEQIFRKLEIGARTVIPEKQDAFIKTVSNIGLKISALAEMSGLGYDRTWKIISKNARVKKPEYAAMMSGLLNIKNQIETLIDVEQSNKDLAG